MHKFEVFILLMIDVFMYIRNNVLYINFEINTYHYLIYISIKFLNFFK